MDLDPTNNKPADQDHVTTAWGRDYRDVVPVRGVIAGGGAQQVKVEVDVRPLTAGARASDDAAAFWRGSGLRLSNGGRVSNAVAKR